MTFYVGIITLHNVSLGIKALETRWDLTMLLQYIHIIQKQRAERKFRTSSSNTATNIFLMNGRAFFVLL